jgi:replicative DNA helicase
MSELVAGYYPASWARELPSNVFAEQALLGALMANNGAYERVAEFLRFEHFAQPIHSRIFQAIEERILDGRLADAVTLKGDLENIGVLDEVGGTRYLAELLSAMIGIVNAGEYGRAIYDTWLRRKLVEIGETIVNTAFGDGQKIDGAAQIEAAERALTEIRIDGTRRDRLVSIGEAVAAAIRASEAAYAQGASPALLSGLEAFDRGMGGFWPGDFTLLGGVPGAGKTALAVQLGCMIGERLRAKAVQAGMSAEEAERQPGVAIFELEMSAEELGARIAAARAGVSVHRLRSGDLDIALGEKLLFVERGVAGLPFRIHDCRATSMKLLGAKIRMHLRRQPERLVIVDHLLVADGDDSGNKWSERNASSVGRATREMKKLAGDVGVPFLVLTHVPRAAGKRDNPRPTMSDVKYAGEGDADNVLFVHRPIMFGESARPVRKTTARSQEADSTYMARVMAWQSELDRAEHLAELVVAKRRMGPTAVERLWWDGPTMAFSDWTRIT